jgi:hypothetical protein
MKKQLFLAFTILLLFSCQNSTNEKMSNDEEKTESKKVDAMIKTDKQKEDSVLAKWQNKVNDSTIKE